ncbi:MAG: hypothetical protein ACI8YQ_003963 [Polaribacter sp.]|jgi:hypothetical protein
MYILLQRNYDSAMKKNGWSPTNSSPGAQKEDRRTMTFKKGGQQVMMNVLAIPKQENRIITIMFKDDLK